MNTSTALRRLRPMMGTFVEVGVLASTLRAIDAAFARMQHVQDALSFQDPDSELSRLNRSSGEWVAVSHCTTRVLRLAKYMMLSSHNLFDCTLGGELVRRGILPAHDSSAHPAGGHADDIEIQPGRARLRRRVQITLDGIAKGYAVDVGIRALLSAGVNSGWINAGGDLRAFGTLTLPIYRRERDGSLAPLGGLRNAAIATSSTGHAYSVHFPGVIVATGSASAHRGTWSVMAARAWRADALTKVAALVSQEHRESTLARFGGRLVATARALQ